jgi:lysophospholipase L1-like esterase
VSAIHANVPRVRAAVVLAALGLLLEGCGRGSPATAVVPSPSPTAVPTPASVHPVSGVVFYDENANGVIDDGEDVRLPHVVLTLGGSSTETDAEGSFAAAAVPAGTRAVEIRPESLPPQFRAGRVPSVAIPLPDGARVPVPVVLPIGANRPNVYLAFGDSITAGIASTRSDDGRDRIAGSLAAERPAYVLILYGTNDWNLSACHRVITCFTIENARSMIRQAKAAGTIPVLSTVIPVNPAYVGRLADERNFWVDETNKELVTMARAEGAIVADLNAAMKAESSDLRELFTDHVHPNDRGYGAMADAFFRALTQPAGR